MRPIFVSTLFFLFCLIHTSQSTYPPGFLFGSATASYQVEGAVRDHRTPSIWDTFSHTPGKTYHNQTGDYADLSYYQFKEDIALLKAMGVKAYRFSISWNRIFLSGRPPFLNLAGLSYYDSIINSLIAVNITPLITLYHWDLPQSLESEIGGWLSPQIVELFVAYADACFTAFGDRVKHWLTFNEPLTFTTQGYGSGTHAPGRCSDRTVCTHGNSSTEPYIVAHHVLLSHAHTVNLYRKKFLPYQGGKISLALNCDWSFPTNNASHEDQLAAQRHLLWQIGWYADPIWKGNYPIEMRTLINDGRLPRFTPAEIALLNGSADFFALNHYTSMWVSAAKYPNSTERTWWTDQQNYVSPVNNITGELVGNRTDSPWLFVVPRGIEQMLIWIADRYGNPPLFITENGVDVPNETSVAEILNDTFRINYLSQYLNHVEKAIDEHHCNVTGYFVWSLLDNFEWADGYSKRFGLHYVDYNSTTYRPRIPKLSATWYKDYVRNKTLTSDF